MFRFDFFCLPILLYLSLSLSLSLFVIVFPIITLICNTLYFMHNLFRNPEISNTRKLYFFSLSMARRVIIINAITTMMSIMMRMIMTLMVMIFNDFPFYQCLEQHLYKQTTHYAHVHTHTNFKTVLLLYRWSKLLFFSISLSCFLFIYFCLFFFFFLMAFTP